MENIVETLISQHRALQQNLGAVSSLANVGTPDANSIVLELGEFTKNLLEHLKLENEEFYPGLLKKMEDKSMDVSKTKEFIAEMDGIGKVVKAFLGKYSVVETIEKEINQFKDDLRGIISALNLRIESEESGVFTYWAVI
jgi:hemerythrin-like domain-containing protein